MARSRRKAFAASLAGALLLLQGLLVPRLDADDGTRRAVLESEHNNSACVVGHDHTICVQAGANRASSSGAIHLAPPVFARIDTLHLSTTAAPPAAVELTKHPRGPPAA
jgi:hypothetical protein